MNRGEHDQALPAYARLQGDCLIIDLGQVETFTITAPTGRRRLLIAPKSGVQITVDGNRVDVVRHDLAGGEDWLLTPKPAGAR
jgi:hypothetical protein